MSLMTAPYNSAMRLGMGFNSYTQQLCINDAVVKSSGQKATEEDLRAAAHSDAAAGTSGPRTGIDANKEILASKSGSTNTVSLAADGQSLISQVVTWEAKFVDKISEVTDSMDIKGSLAIKVDAIGGGGGASGYFVDSNKFKESDINYLIQVKVTNQKLIADDVTQFAPLKYVQPSQFTDVYGDSYISGFLEGGVFNALISVKYRDKSQLKKFGGQLDIDLNFKVASVKGSAGGGKEDASTSSDKETTINVSWSGGGDIKPDNVKEWTVDSLLQVAMEFPDRVAKCPQYTSAVLTKYSGLRSFHEQSVKGSPLDYENAGMYSSALLDAYMDYKLIWKQIQTTIWEVDNNVSSLAARTAAAALTEYAEDFNKAFAEQKKKYEASQKPDNRGAITQGHIEEPIPPNKVVPYGGDIFGLDKARRDCRFEMIKIVREVDAVAFDPAVATDPNRNYQYLSPVIFRLLLPIKSNLNKEQELKDIAELENQVKALKKINEDTESQNKKYKDAFVDVDKTKAELKEAQDEKTKLKGQLDQKTKEYDEAQAQLGPLKKTAEKITTQPQSGLTAAAGWNTSKNLIRTTPVSFSPAYPQPPRMLYGISHVDSEYSQPIKIACHAQDIKSNGFTAQHWTFQNGFSYGHHLSWLTLPENDIHMETGVFDTYDFPKSVSGSDTFVVSRINFTRPFTSPPKVVFWFYELNLENGWHSVALQSGSVRAESFDLRINSWASRKFEGVRVGWFAYDSAEHNKRIKSGRVRVERNQPWRMENLNFEGQAFTKNPATFFALCEIDSGDDKNLRLDGKVETVGTTSMRFQAGTWATGGDHNLDHADWTWIALE